MTEISQILEHEEKNKEIVQQEETKIETELREKEANLEQLLEVDSILPAEKKQELLIERENGFKEIENEKKKELDIKLTEVGRNKGEKMETAADHIIKSLFKD